MNPTATAPSTSGSPAAPPNLGSIMAQYGYTPPAAPAGGSNSGDWYSQVTAKTPGAPVPVASPGLPGSHAFATPTAPLVSNPVADINKAGADVNADITTPGNPIVQGTKAASDAAMAIPNVVADVIPGGKAALGAIGDIFGKATNIAGNIGNTMADITQKLGMMSPEQRAQYDKQAADFANSATGQDTTKIAETLNNLGNIANVILGAKGGAEGAQTVADAVPGAIDTVKQGAATIKNAVTKTPEETAAANAASDAAKIKAVADEWQKPADANSASFNKARGVLTKDKTIPQTLAQLKINPYAHIEDGKYSTADTAEAIRESSGKMSNEMLRPSLEAADKTTPPTPVKDVISSAIENVTKDKSLTSGDRAAIISSINKEGEAMGADHPDGLSLTDAHDRKITYSQNAGYNPAKSNADNNTAIANRAIASSLQSVVESKAPPGLPVHEFNSELAKNYRAADYLDSLNTKKAPVSNAQIVAHRAAEVVGAVVGHGIGGGILGGVGGYMIGGTLEHMFENLSGKARGTFLTNLKTENPAAFAKVQDYLDSQSTPR